LANTRRRFDRCSNYGVSLGLVFRTPYRPPSKPPASVPRDQSFCHQLADLIGGISDVPPDPRSAVGEKASQKYFSAIDRATEIQNPNQVTAIGDPRIYRSGGPSERSVQMYTAGEVNLEPTPCRGIRRCRPRCRRPTSVRTACVTQLDRRRRDSDQCRSWVNRVTLTARRSLPLGNAGDFDGKRIELDKPYRSI
jgi:hypothetical protein